MRSALTIIVTTYKRPEPLGRCLDSIRTAINSSSQLIVVDDSQEGEGFAAATHHGALYVRKGRTSRRGPAASRNVGLAVAEGRYVAFIDDDDAFAPGGLEALVRQANGSEFVFGDYDRVTDGSRQATDLSAVSFDTLLVSNSIPVGAFIVLRSAIHYPFDEHLRSHEDWDFLLKNAPHEGMKHVPGTVVSVSASTVEETYSARDQAKRHYWLDFLSIYARHPAPHVAPFRAQAMARLGIDLPEEILRIEPRFASNG